MTKELEALHRIANANNHFKYDTLELMDKDFQIVQQGLLRLEAIDNAKPSEALEKLFDTLVYSNNKIEAQKYYDTIKNYILKAQEQEKVLKIIFEKRVNFYDVYLFTKVENYNNIMITMFGYPKEFLLSKEEFDLLKRYFNEQD